MMEVVHGENRPPRVLVTDQSPRPKHRKPSRSEANRAYSHRETNMLPVHRRSIRDGNPSSRLNLHAERRYIELPHTLVVVLQEWNTIQPPSAKIARNSIRSVLEAHRHYFLVVRSPSECRRANGAIRTGSSDCPPRYPLAVRTGSQSFVMPLSVSKSRNR